MTGKRIDILTLGCSKNLVDSERLMAQLRHAGYVVQHDPEVTEGDICIVNTCGFIGDAKEESINVILNQGQRRADGTLRRLYVMGCLSQRYLAELQAEIPEVDGWYGKFDWPKLLDELGHTWDSSLTPGRTLTTPAHYAYIKISEGSPSSPVATTAGPSRTSSMRCASWWPVACASSTSSPKS